GFEPIDELDDRQVDLNDFAEPLSAIGYTADVPLETKLAAFRLRFHVSRSGPPSHGDLTTARMVANNFAIDRTKSSS
ncbi:MAG: hypothetical protein ACR2O2_17660, partial [Ruegeria sp.]